MGSWIYYMMNLMATISNVVFFLFFQLWLDLFSDSACILQGKLSCDCILQGKMGCTQLAINVPVLPLRHMQPPKKH